AAGSLIKIRMIRSQSARQHAPTSPWRGEVGERRRREPGGGDAESPHPDASRSLGIDPPPPSTSDVSDVDPFMIAEPGNTRVRWEGEAGVALRRQPSKRTSYAMRSFARPIMGVLMFGLAGCTDDVGYVEVKTFPGFNVPLYLDTAKLEGPFKNGTTVVRQQVGKTKLQLERGGQFLSLCEFDVRKNRIVTVKLTVAGFERVPRCELKK